MDEKLPNEWLGYCEDACNGPIFGRSKWHLAVGNAAFWIWMRLPYWLATRKIGLAILHRTGGIAFACHCQNKNDEARRANQIARGENAVQIADYDCPNCFGQNTEQCGVCGDLPVTGDWRLIILAILILMVGSAALSLALWL